MLKKLLTISLIASSCAVFAKSVDVQIQGVYIDGSGFIDGLYMCHTGYPNTRVVGKLSPDEECTWSIDDERIRSSEGSYIGAGKYQAYLNYFPGERPVDLNFVAAAAIAVSWKIDSVDELFPEFMRGHEEEPYYFIHAANRDPSLFLSYTNKGGDFNFRADEFVNLFIKLHDNKLFVFKIKPVL